MANDISIDDLNPQFRELLERMPAGEKVNLVDPDGKRVAVVYSIRPEKPMSREEWLAQLDTLAERITRAWKSDKNAVEIVSEMRR